MATQDRTVLVTGATGKQGGAVARHLLDKGWSVRALTRDATKPAALALAEAGAEVTQGDMDKPGTIRAAMQGAVGVYSVQNTWEVGPEREIAEGKGMADLVKELGIERFVYSSVGGAERKTGIPHFDSKWVIEEYIRGIGLPVAILRPVFFMENFNGPGLKDAIMDGKLPMAMRPDKPLAMVSVDDIGAFAAMAFERPDEFVGKAIELAGDNLTMPGVAALFSKAMGKHVEHIEVPIEELRKQNPDYAQMFEWFNSAGYEPDLTTLRKIHPKLKTLADWLNHSAWDRRAVAQR